MKTIFFVAITILVMHETTHALRCGPCHGGCTPAYQLRCKGGLTYDVCWCCAVCAKVKGEKCGGPYRMNGTCDRGLVCRRIGKHSFGRFQSGICVPK